MSGNRLVFIIIFISVFILMMIIGLSSGVSTVAGLTRALSAAAFFTALSFGTSFIIARYVINDIKPADTGQMLDIMVSEPPEEQGEAIPEPSDINDENLSNQEINPLVTRQIDPNVEKVINNDPKRMADIMKKMGFEE